MLRFFKTQRRPSAIIAELEERLADLELVVKSHTNRLRRMQAHLAAERSAQVRHERNTEETPNDPVLTTDDYYNGRY